MGVCLHPFPDVPGQPVAVDEVVRGAERDEGVVAEPSAAEQHGQKQRHRQQPGKTWPPFGEVPRRVPRAARRSAFLLDLGGLRGTNLGRNTVSRHALAPRDCVAFAGRTCWGKCHRPSVILSEAKNLRGFQILRCASG